MRHATVVEGVVALCRSSEEHVAALAGTDLDAVGGLALGALRYVPGVTTEHVDLEAGEDDRVIEEAEVGEADQHPLARARTAPASSAGC